MTIVAVMVGTKFSMSEGGDQRRELFKVSWIGVNQFYLEDHIIRNAAT